MQFYCHLLADQKYKQRKRHNAVSVEAGPLLHRFLMKIRKNPLWPTFPLQKSRQDDKLLRRILSEWQGAEWVAIQCPCRIDCGCMPLNEVPRIVLPNCLYAGELDYFFVAQPFLATYGFRVRWHCDECEDEMACGFPLGM